MSDSVIDGIDYGPLAHLVGRWIGTKGVDDAPDANAESDISAYTDELSFILAGRAENAEEQELVAIRYHHLVRKNENGQIFHDQIGHWLYEAATGLVMHSLTIPRGICLLAGGDLIQENASCTFRVEATEGSDTFGIVQSPFMLAKARTKAFKMQLTVQGNSLHYRQTTALHIYGKDFEHHDESKLQRVTYDLD